MGLGWLVLLFIALLAPSTIKAQIGGSGAIEGTVADSTGALVVGAKVIAQNTATGVETSRITNKSGLYNLSPLDAGDYSVVVSAAGFETLVREDIHLDGMQALALNLTLQIGAASQTITVKDEPPPLETENATLGAAMENEVYQSLPLEMGAAGAADQRRATDFAALMPGVTANETKNNETDEPMVINGNQNSSEMYLEGIPMTSVSVAGDPRYIWSAFSVETVDQFQLKTSAYSAEYRGLGIENYTIKSGGKQFHGSVYDVLRNTAFDAVGFLPALNTVATAASKAAGGGNVYFNSPPPEHQNEYGISLGGPIWKNKLFFFGNYLGFRYTTATNPSFYTVPTTLMRSGNFSELMNPALETTAQTIYDPITQTCVSTSNCSRTAYNAGTGTQGPGINGQTGANVIPASEISPIAQAMEQYLPAPTNSNITSNYLGSVAWGLNNWTQSERLDYDLSDKQKMSVIVGAGRQGLIGTVQGSASSTNLEPLPYQSGKIYRPITKDIMFEHTYVINNSLVNQFKYGAMQYYSPAINPSLVNPAWAATAFGITGLPGGQVSQSFPTVKFSEVTQWGPTASAGNVTNNFVALDNVQWIRGKHAFTFGGQYQWLQYNFEADRTGTSPLTLGTSLKETEGFKGNNTVTALGNSGWDYASFMIGAMDSSTYTQYAPIATETGTRFQPFALFANDDYRVTNKLTVNAGLRWDYLPPFHEAENRFSFMNPNVTNPYTGSAGALQFAGGSNGSTPISTYYNNWGPRLGLAYAVDNKTVVRASIGMYYALGGGTGGTANSTQPGTALILGYSAAPNPPSPGVVLPAFYLNGNPALSAQAGHKVLTYANDPTNTSFGGVGYSYTVPPIQDPGYGTFYSTASTGTIDSISSTLGYLDPKFGGRAPEFTGWSFGVQRSLTKDMTATVSYVGNEGHHILGTGTTERGYYGNLMDPKWLSLGANLSETATAANLAANGLSLPYPTFPTTQPFSQMLKPFPQYSGLTDEVDAVSNSNYHSLQLSINQRLAHGLTMMLNYTFSKSLDNAGTFRSGYAIPANVSADGKAYAQGKADYSLSGFDQRQDVTGTATYDLPFGRGHIGNNSAIVRSLASGWRISGIFTYIGGNPLAIIQNTCSGNSVGEQCMPALTPGFTGSARQNGGWGQGATRLNLSSLQYINPAAFTASGTSTSGTAGTLTNPYVIGNAARTAPYGLRGPGNDNLDTSVRRTFDLWNKENVKFVFEASAFNTGNHVWFGSTSTNGAGGAIGQSLGGSGTFGAVTGQANNPRQYQFAGHITF
ncbi:MAG: TonB-dependent receptor [Terracidiphilus sp.]|jgi:hypothetical protein